MPHPENLIDPLVGGTDGRDLFESVAVFLFSQRRPDLRFLPGAIFACRQASSAAPTERRLLSAQRSARCPSWANGGMSAPVIGKKSGAPISLAMACFVPSGGARVGHRLRASRGRDAARHGLLSRTDRAASGRDFRSAVARHLACRCGGRSAGACEARTGRGQPPFHFSISYDDAAIQPGRRYAVRASVTDQGRVLFTSDRSYPVFNGGNGPLTLLLVSARRAEGQCSSCRRTEICGRSLFRGRSAAR